LLGDASMRYSEKLILLLRRMLEANEEMRPTIESVLSDSELRNNSSADVVNRLAWGVSVQPMNIQPIVTRPII